MELFEAIDQRHSYRGTFKNLPISRDDLRRIVQAGLQAPSGCNGQTTSFVIIDQPALIEQIALIVPKSFVKAASALIVCIIDPTPLSREYSFALEDCAAAVENMLLAITALGYATVWLDGFLREAGRGEKLTQLLAVPAPRTVQVLLPIGVPAESWDRKEKLPFEQRAWFNHYGQE